MQMRAMFGYGNALSFHSIFPPFCWLVSFSFFQPRIFRDHDFQLFEIPIMNVNSIFQRFFDATYSSSEWKCQNDAFYVIKGYYCHFVANGRVWNCSEDATMFVGSGWIVFNFIPSAFSSRTTNSYELITINMSKQSNSNAMSNG